MKKQDDIHITFRVIIKDISPKGSDLSDEQLRLVAGGLKPKQAYRGMTGCTPQTMPTAAPSRTTSTMRKQEPETIFPAALPSFRRWQRSRI